MPTPKIVKEPQTSTNGLVPVLLNKRYGKYQPGDVAGFTRDRSEHLVKVGAAQFVEADKPDAAPAKK